MSDLLVFSLYFIGTCACVRDLADNSCYLSVYVPDPVRYCLLILAFMQPKISVFAVIAQVAIYISTALELAINFIDPGILTGLGVDLELVLAYVLLVHFGSIVVGRVDQYLWEFRHKRR